MHMQKKALVIIDIQNDMSNFIKKLDFYLSF